MITWADSERLFWHHLIVNLTSQGFRPIKIAYVDAATLLPEDVYQTHGLSLGSADL